MPILFTDFDGVLHPEHCHESKHFCRLPILEDVLRRVPECQVVITSTWRLQQDLDSLRKRFSPDVASMIKDVTPKYSELHTVPPTLVSYEREAECHAWLWANNSQHCPWLALDDRAWLYRPFCKSLFTIDGTTGLTLAAGAQLEARLHRIS